jgi:epoxide hydrolase-like predicted phosphatase
VIHAVIFDCFGVLVHGSLNHLRSLAPPEHLDALNDLSHSSDYGYVSEAEYLQGVGELLGKTSQEIFDIIHAQYIRNEEMIALVRSLRGHYKTALLSNVGRGVIAGLFTPEELESLFDVVILSSEVGMVKPHPDIYELAAERLGVAPSECIMIDDLPANTAGAEATGMQSKVCMNPVECAADLRVQLLESEHARTA